MHAVPDPEKQNVSAAFLVQRMCTAWEHNGHWLGTEVCWKTAEGILCSLKLFILSREFQCRDESLGTRRMCLKGKRLKFIDLLYTNGKEQGAPVWKEQGLWRDDGEVCLQGECLAGAEWEHQQRRQRPCLWWVAAAMAFRVFAGFPDACLKTKQS